MTTPTKRLFYRLLYDALIEMRMEGYETNNRLVYLLADLFHNVPLQLDRAERQELTVDDIMQLLRERAHRNGMEAWLNLRLDEESGAGLS